MTDSDVISEKCFKCGGKCCEIYSRRPPDLYFEEYVESWNEMFIESGANAFAPLFEPLEVNLAGNEKLAEDLRARGIDPMSCQYRGQSGCILPRRFRPEVCRKYVCKT